MRTALIGYSGFVGSNIARQIKFDDYFNSKNISEVRGKEYDDVIFAAAKAEKWRANLDPESDKMHVDNLKEILRGLRANRVTLISTVDVYRVPLKVDEDSVVETEGLHPYGANRYSLENFVQANFIESHVIRLPALFGKGLKKNVIFDLIHENNLNQINPKSQFQFYDLNAIGLDIARVKLHEIPLINLVTQPIQVHELLPFYTGHHDFGLANKTAASRSEYDVRSIYGELWGQSNSYLKQSDEVLEGIRNFVGSFEA